MLALQRTRAHCWAGGLELLGVPPSDSPCLGDSTNALVRDGEATSAPLILGPFAHTSALPMAQTRVPAREDLITLVLCRLTQLRKEVVSGSPWSCVLSFSLDLPKERGRCRSQ